MKYVDCLTRYHFSYRLRYCLKNQQHLTQLSRVCNQHIEFVCLLCKFSKLSPKKKPGCILKTEFNSYMCSCEREKRILKKIELEL